ncbi:hypothetical protein [Okeania hirsuta]|uniref:hypothetical protein n=2 Tax=Okeania TaxID=1458928 RepID=UPI001F010012|nr:hypothetical protein [Okeania hirsuta]
MIKLSTNQLKQLYLKLIQIPTILFFVWVHYYLLKMLNCGLIIIDQIARQAILISIDETTEEFIKNFVVPVYEHSKMVIGNAMEDYFILGWTSQTTGIPIRTRMIYIEKNN